MQPHNVEAIVQSEVNHFNAIAASLLVIAALGVVRRTNGTPPKAKK